MIDPLFGKWTFGNPRAATQADIAQLINSFAHAAEYLDNAGFDGINLHAAHGYLLAQFLSPRTNKRTDSYGGTVTNRARLIIEIVQEIRRRVSHSFIISAKLNSTDFQDDGLTPEDTRELVRVLIGLDFVELSGGTYERLAFEHIKESTRKREAFFLEFAEMIVPGLGVGRKTKVFITGGLRTVGAMVGALDIVDGVGLARPAAQEPRLAADIIANRVRGAIRPIVPFDTDTGLGFVAASMQMKQIANGMEPLNLSDNEDIEIVRKIIKESQEKEESQGADVEIVGSPDWSGKFIPYGSGLLEKV
jgi:2,4-dienoyl-CoA reductase-like NADH-dependent reductase (Old Yellow Enzyme family)